jgi:hypothetical protein
MVHLGVKILKSELNYYSVWLFRCLAFYKKKKKKFEKKNDLFIKSCIKYDLFLKKVE